MHTELQRPDGRSPQVHRKIERWRASAAVCRERHSSGPRYGRVRAVAPPSADSFRGDLVRGRHGSQRRSRICGPAWIRGSAWRQLRPAKLRPSAGYRRTSRLRHYGLCSRRIWLAKRTRQLSISIKAELDKLAPHIQQPICVDAKAFLQELLRQKDAVRLRDHSAWDARCADWKTRYPVVTDEHRNPATKVSHL